jgi:RNA polymerase sigma-70 factor (ECF subfamily)
MVVTPPRGQVSRLPAARSPSGVVRALPFEGDDTALVQAILAGRTDAATVFYDRHVDSVQRLAFRLLGPDTEMEDVVHDVFLRALESMPRLRDPAALRGWLFGITIRVVRTRIQRRIRQRWLKIMDPQKVPDIAAVSDAGLGEAMRDVYAILDLLPADERIALVLHRVEGLSLEQAAATCETSLATLRRRLARAETKFFSRAEKKPALAPWLGGHQQ